MSLTVNDTDNNDRKTLNFFYKVKKKPVILQRLTWNVLILSNKF